MATHVKREGLDPIVALIMVAALLALCLSASSQEVVETTQISPYCRTGTALQQDGETAGVVVIGGPPEPPAGFERPAVESPRPNSDAGVNVLSDVPAFSWCFGCSATSAAMIAGYYDRTGYSSMYTGPSNGGVMPLGNSVWGTWTDSCSANRAQCPLSATRNGVDGRVAKGHVDDYWVCYGDPGPDPFSGNWTEHTWGDCTADFMKTNQAAYGNTDGETTFWYYPSGAKWTGTTASDGGYGLQLFYESRGYVVHERYSRVLLGYDWDGSGSYYSPATQGATFGDFKAEIDAGRPVMIHLLGHTVVGVGYDDSSSTIYIHDTWDHSVHTMTWGGTYYGMLHFGVTIVTLETWPEIDVQRPAGNAIADGGTDDVGSHPVGEVATFVYTISNVGPSDLTVTDVSASNLSGCGGFALSTALPLVVPADSSEELSISVTPSAAWFSLDLAIDNTDSNESPYNISIVGGVPATIDVSPVSSSSVTPADGTGSIMLSVTNSGDRDLVWSVSVTNVSFPAPSIAPEGGPDNYGYTWTSSSAPGGPAYNWIDITETGTSLSLDYCSDDQSAELPLLFPFTFYGSVNTGIHITENGYLTFAPYGVRYSSPCIPATDTPNNLVAPFWEDICAGSNIYYLAEVDRFVVSWEAVEMMWGGSERFTLQAMLSRDGQILFQYKSVLPGDTGPWPTIGIESPDGTDGLQVICRDPSYFPVSEHAIRIDSPASWIRVGSAGGTTVSGDTTPLSITLDAAELSSGDVCTCDIVLSSNDPNTPSVTVPVVMQVSAPAGTASVLRVDEHGRVLADGTVFASQFSSGSADVAEWVTVSEPVDAGTILEIDAEHPGCYRPSQDYCSALIGGVVSTQPGLVLGEEERAGDLRAVMALSGIVPVKVTDEGGPIRTGDLLVSSLTAGHAARWSGAEPCPCSLVGKALQPMVAAKGIILVLLTAH